MTTDPLNREELERARDGGSPPEPPCSGCGTAPKLESDGVWHFRHEEGCRVMARIKELPAYVPPDTDE
jgi:hypothetical protein